MADADKKSFPRIARSVWFSLREKFKQRMPQEVSPTYVGTMLGMEPASASANVIPALRAFGLIDENGKPTDRAVDWRDDSKYAEVCQEILEEVYPQELRDLFHGDTVDVERLKSWFSRKTRVGDAAATKFAITYAMLLEGDLEKSAPASKPRSSEPRATKTARPATKKATKTAAAPPASSTAAETNRGRQLTPKLHIDIQIHISPDSTAEQIDKIFESMSKHLRDFEV